MGPQGSATPFLEAGSARAVRPKGHRAGSDDSTSELAPHILAEVKDEEEEGEPEVRDSIRPLEERMEKAKRYYPDRDPEAEEPGGSSANSSHPLTTEGDQHGLGHHGGPEGGRSQVWAP